MSSERKTGPLWRRRRIGISLSVASIVPLGLAMGAFLGLLSYGFLNATWIVVLGAVMVVSLIVVIPATATLVHANQELQRRGEFDLKALRQRTAESRRKSAKRMLFLIPLYDVFIVLAALALRSMGVPRALPWGAVASLLGLSALSMVLTVASQRRAAADAAGR